MKFGIWGKKVIMALLPFGLNKSLGPRVGESPSTVRSEHDDYSTNTFKSPEGGGSRGQGEV